MIKQANKLQFKNRFMLYKVPTFTVGAVTLINE